MTPIAPARQFVILKTCTIAALIALAGCRAKGPGNEPPSTVLDTTPPTADVILGFKNTCGSCHPNFKTWPGVAANAAAVYARIDWEHNTDEEQQMPPPESTERDLLSNSQTLHRKI